ncbi:purine nucleoside permease [Halovivax limisalsi]|uniref:purine nucleoside permease n=1 Tax=Halovivax limisalsi TaxID=1453760 RepID=UPI001FFD0492|nr:purine nucleoside permease [Halovivax limisalsi]
MTGSLPTPRPLDPTAAVEPAVLVLPAVTYEPPFDERRRWLDRLSIRAAYTIPGAESPLYLSEDGVAVTTTGLGKAPAATTVAALWCADGLDLDATTVISAGIAGAPPERASLGSVFVADAVLDWDRKHRWDPDEVADAESADDQGDGPVTVEPLAYEPEGSLHEPDPTLVERAREATSGLELHVNERVRAFQDRYPAAPDHGPRTGAGPTITSDEFWHGTSVAREVESLCAAYGIDPYVTTQMEDAATATALARFDAADRYLSLRAVANYDRPAPDEHVHESFEGTDASVDLAAENVARAGIGIVNDLLGLL